MYLTLNFVIIIIFLQYTFCSKKKKKKSQIVIPSSIQYVFGRWNTAQQHLIDILLFHRITLLYPLVLSFWPALWVKNNLELFQFQNNSKLFRGKIVVTMFFC